MLELSAGSGHGDGAYVGDFVAANVDSVTVDLFIEDLDEFEKVDCGISTKGPEVTPPLLEVSSTA